MNVLCVEDDRRIADILTRTLTEEGHHVAHVSSGLDAEEHILTGCFEVVVLDLMLPGQSGFEVLEHIRRARSGTPVLVLSARDAMPDIIRALDLGADDYLTKPFHLDMLLARVRSVSRRGSIAETPTLEASGLLLDRARHEVRKGGELIALTKREFALLEALMRRAGRVVSREQLIEAGWGLAADVSDNSLEFHIHGLRSKLQRIAGSEGRGQLRTLRGLGYQLE